MEWKDINVFQYQQIVTAIEKKDSVERDMILVSIVKNMTENQVSSLPIREFNKIRHSLSFLSKDVTGKPQKYISINGRRYKCIYDVRNMPSARYIETKYFTGNFIDNLHKLAATMVIPMKKTIFGWKVKKYDASDHDIYSQDMLEAKFVDVYHSVVFFYHVYRNWMEVSRGYLIRQFQNTMSIQRAELEVQSLLNTLDGNIQPKLLPTMKIVKYRKLMK